MALAALAFTAVLFTGSFTPSIAQAEVSEIRVGRNTGLGYLPVYVAQELQLIEKHAKAGGLGDVKVSYSILGSPGAVNDAILANAVDLGVAGVTGLFTIWDKTKGKLDVKGVAALGSSNNVLVSTNPDIKRLEDITEKDRIALPTVKVSTQAITL